MDDKRFAYVKNFNVYITFVILSLLPADVTVVKPKRVIDKGSNFLNKNSPFENGN